MKENKEFDIEGLIPEKEYIIESMTYQQIQDERNNIIEDPKSESENQTVINCTQSDQEDSSVDYEERISDRNAIIDESSLEYASVPQNYNPIHETTSEDHDEPDEEIHEERVFEYHNEHNEGENEEPEITSRREQRDISEHEQESEHSGPNYYPDSNESYSDIDMDEEAIEKFLNEPPPLVKDNGFEKTLTNMRLAFGSEKHIRENSVKTLERLDKSHRDSGSDEKTDEKSSVFEKNSFQDFSLKKFTELMNVKNMKNFKTSMQKTFREYNKANIFSNSDKKASKMSSTPKKSSCISPRKFSMRDLELDRIGYEKMKENSEKKNKFIQNIMGSSSSQNKQSHSSILYKTNLSLDKCRKEINMEDISDDQSSKNIEYKISSPKKNYQLLNDKQEKEEFALEAQHVKSYDSPEPSKSVKSKRSS